MGIVSDDDFRSQIRFKNGVGVFGDIGSISHLINYETSLPPKFDIKLKGFCCYNEADYNRLTEMQKQKLLDQHSKELVVFQSHFLSRKLLLLKMPSLIFSWQK